MKAIIDRERLHRRGTLSHVASLGGLAIILGAVVLSRSQPVGRR
jgi:hypothetical protein